VYTPLLTIQGDAFSSDHVQRLASWQKVSPVISKCANPSCSKVLMRLDGGRFFGFPVRDKGTIEHFWLCAACSKHFTLKLIEGKVELVARHHKKIA
jgi:hypothetical protein